MLLLMLLVQHAAADISRVPSIAKNITSCPDKGYFFQRELVPNAIDPGPCLLCFCHGSRDTSAICWPRDSSRCDVKNYRHYGDPRARSRRSLGFGDIFFRDAARDILDKRTEEQCKPYESSFSEGCPPADWCIGCTVCDCDANGRWDCHVLSFCPDKNGQKKKIKKPTAPLRKRIVKRNDKNNKKVSNIRNTKAVKPATKKPYKKPYKKPSVKQPVKKPLRKAHMKNISSKKVQQVNKTQKKPKRPTNTKPANKKMLNKRPNARETSQKAYKKALQNVKQKNDTAKLAEAIVKRVMSKVERIMTDNQKNTVDSMSKSRVVQKRSMQKHYKPNKGKAVKTKNNKHNKTVKKVNRKPWNKKVAFKKQTPQPNEKKLRRQKRSLTSLESMSNNYIVEPTPVYQSLWENYTNIELVEDRNFNYTTAPAQAKNYYKYDVTKDENKMENTKPMAPKTTLFDHIYHTDLSSALIFHHKKSSFDEWEDLDKMYKNRKYLKPNITREKLIQYQFENKVKNISQNATKGKACGLKKIFTKFFFGLNPNNTDGVKAKVKSMNLLSMLRSLLDTVFDKQKNRSKKYIRIHSQHDNVLNALCINFGACHADFGDKILRSKFNDLDKETRDIFKSVSSIKGLLYFLKNSDQNTLNISQEDDMTRLKAIIREHYMEDATPLNMTDTQRVQANYVKQNAEEFVKSVEKFAFTLSDILKIMEHQNETNKNKRMANRHLRCAKHLSARSENRTLDDKVTRLKKLLLSYNLVQNRFMSKMYDALAGLEGNLTTIENASEKESNDSIRVDDYSKSVITNLRKLKDLGQKISPKRLKREAMGDDDAIEYLLMLMEYLLKKNKPVDAAPVNDGIDLLIDAIKNSPDIKPIKITKFRPFRPTPTRTTESLEEDLNTLHTVENTLKGNFNFKAADALADDADENVKFLKVDGFEKPHDTKAYKSRKNIDDGATDVVPVYINTKKEADKKIEAKILKPKYDLFNAEGDDEYEGETTTKKMKAVDTTRSEYKGLEDKEIDKEHEKLQHIEFYSTDNDAKKEDKHSKISPGLDWVEDAGDQEVKTATTVTTESTTHTTEARPTLKSRLVTRTHKKHKDKYANPVSSMSSEELQSKRPSKKSNDIGVGNQKIDIFNSLDYNTDKVEIDSDSKEDKVDAFSDFV